MSDLATLLRQHALLLAAGSTLLLAIGCGCMRLTHSPIHRQRIGEMTLIGVLAWLLLALFPLPRLLPDYFSLAGPVSSAANDEPTDASASATTAIVERSGTHVAGLSPTMAELPIEDWSLLLQPTEPASLTTAPGEELNASPSEENELVAVATPPNNVSTGSLWSSSKLFSSAGLRIGLVYLAGAAACAAWLCIGHLLLLYVRLTSHRPQPWLGELYRSLRGRDERLPGLLLSHICSRPLSWGAISPVIVLPDSLCHFKNRQQLRTILLHELGHISQRDAWGNLLLSAAFPLLYFHPLFWWLRGEVRLAAELVADDWAAQKTGKETYVEELVAFAKCTGGGSVPLIGVTGLFSSPSQFYRRMQMLLARETPLATAPSPWWRISSLLILGAGIMLAAAAAGVRPVSGQQTEPVEPKAASGVTETRPAPQDTPAVPRYTIQAVETKEGATFQIGPSPAPPPAETKPTEPKADPNQPASNGDLIRKLEAERDSLVKQIRDLQDRLQAVEKGATRYGPASVRAVQPQSKYPHGAIVTARVEADGTLVEEIWTVDEKGQPGKVLATNRKSGLAPRTVTARAEPQPNAAIPEDGKTVHTVKEKGGERWVEVYELIADGKTGKLIKSYRLENPAAAPSVPATGLSVPVPTTPKGPMLSPPPAEVDLVGKGPPSVPVYPVPATSTPAYERATSPTPSGFSPFQGLGSAAQPEANAAAGSARQLDLVGLAAAYADAVAAVDAAKAMVAEYEGSTRSAREAKVAEVALASAQRKEKLLRQIAEVALKGAGEELEHVTRRYESAQVTISAVNEVRSRVEILKQILSTTSAPVPTPKAPDQPKR